MGKPTIGASRMLFGGEAGVVTGVFFHESFVGRSWPVVGDRYVGFPELLETLAREIPELKLFKPKPVSEELLLKVHSKSHVDRVKRAWYYEGARLTVGGCVEACERVWKGELRNAVVFLVAAGHHAGRDYAWGGTYISCIGPTLYHLKSLGLKRMAYIDTDSHHGDGARDILRGRDEVLHICFCSQDVIEDHGTKICIDVGWRTSDGEYLNKVRGVFPKIEEFKPELILHFFGHDTHVNDYGSRGLTENFYVELARIMKGLADAVCKGKYVVLDGGGANVEVAKRIWPKIIRILVNRLNKQSSP